MTCHDVELELIAYHFGLLIGEKRGEVEAHLIGCGACLRAFLDIKRAVETGEDGPAPSDLVRPRLRRAVAEELGIVQRPRSRWERPAAFAFAAAAMLVANVAAHTVTTGPGTPPYALSHAADARAR